MLAARRQLGINPGTSGTANNLINSNRGNRNIISRGVKAPATAESQEPFPSGGFDVNTFSIGMTRYYYGTGRSDTTLEDVVT